MIDSSSNLKVASVFILIVLFFLPATWLKGNTTPPSFMTYADLFSLSAQEFATTSNRALKKDYGLKLNWKERMALNIMRRKVKRHLRKHPEAQCQPLWSYANQEEQPFIESLSLLSLLFGLGGPVLIFVAYSPIGFLFAGAAIVLGILSLSRITKNPDRYSKASKAMAIAGIVFGSLLAILFLVVIISFGAA